MIISRGPFLTRLLASLAVIAAGVSIGSDLWAAPSNNGAKSSQEKSSQEKLPAVTVHAPDAFYDPPASVPDKPGSLLRSEPLKNVKLPQGMRGWRILYTTTLNDTTAATAVATVFAPIHPPAGRRPVITWEHGTTGLLQRCMPSLTSEPTLGIPALDRVVRAGWVIVATDYSFAEKGGPLPFLIGEGEARAALDSVRAAHQMRELALDPRTVVWGHSQGGHAALWTGIIGPRYAPDVNIAGVVAIAPAANMARILELNPAVDKLLGPYLAASYSRFYPDLIFEQAVLAPAQTAAREMAGLCSVLPPEDPQRITALSKTFEGGVLATATNKALASHLAENAPLQLIPAPLLVVQGLEDIIVSSPATDQYVERRCDATQRLEYWTFAGFGHHTIVQPDSPLEARLAGWTAARFANEPQQDECDRKSY